MKQINRPRWASPALLAAIVDATEDGVIAATLEGAITSVNPAAAAMFGYSADELLTLSVADLAVPERAEAINGILHRLARGEQVPRYRTFLRKKDGTRFLVSASVSLVPGDEGRPPLAAAIVRDVSRETGAPRTRALLAAIVNSSEDAIYARTPDGLVASWNQSAERLFGYSRDEIVGRCIRTLVPQDVLPEFDEMDMRVMSGEATAQWETIRVTKGGRRIPVSVTAFRVTAADGSILGAASIARDMLRTAKTQEAFRKLEQLTGRERDVLGLMSDGLGNAEISTRLGLSPQTVKNYVSRILAKLNATSRTQAAASFLSLRSFLGPSAPEA